jgi:hypothetical protein
MSNNLRLPGEPKRLARVGSSDLLGVIIVSSLNQSADMADMVARWLKPRKHLSK